MPDSRQKLRFTWLEYGFNAGIMNRRCPPAVSHDHRGDSGSVRTAKYKSDKIAHERWEHKALTTGQQRWIGHARPIAANAVFSRDRQSPETLGALQKADADGEHGMSSSGTRRA